MFPITDSIKSKKSKIITILIILANIFVFYLELTSFDSNAFINKYSLIPNTVNFKAFSSLVPFVTAMFLHGGFLHIATNMLFLWVFGGGVEGYFGGFLFLLVYLLSGVIGNLTEYSLMSTSSIPMLGASGAIAGILGSYFVLFPYSKIKTLLFLFFFVTLVDIPAPFILGYWFLLQVVSGTFSLITPQSGGIAFFAHVGGFATGIIFTIIYSRYFKKE